MIGIVLVSHSRKLADAALELAREMVPGDSPVVRIAAGTADGGIGTDATAVAAVISEVASPDGVLVLMDLGSAVLSAELALEFLGDLEAEVRLSSAPVVEGLLAAVVRAAGGATLDEVDREARGALAAKESQLQAPPTEVDEPAATSDDVDTVERRFVVTNAEGLHARPASMLAATISVLEARVRIASNGKTVADARSLIGLMALGVRKDQEILVSATGPQATAALDEIGALIADQFGER